MDWNHDGVGQRSAALSHLAAMGSPSVHRPALDHDWPDHTGLEEALPRGKESGIEMGHCDGVRTPTSNIAGIWMGSAVFVQNGTYPAMVLY